MLNTLSHGSPLPGHMLSLDKGFIDLLVTLILKWTCRFYKILFEITSNKAVLFWIAPRVRKGRELTILRISCGPSDCLCPIMGFNRLQCPILIFDVDKEEAREVLWRKLGIDLSNGCFAIDNLHLAWSRAPHPPEISVFSGTKDWEKMNIKNPEVLSFN